MVLDVKTGAVLSARKYSSDGFENYNRLVKSIIISSGPSPMAYVLSEYKSSGSSCSGQHLYKFDPKIITVHPSAWTKKTTGSGS